MIETFAELWALDYFSAMAVDHLLHGDSEGARDFLRKAQRVRYTLTPCESTRSQYPGELLKRFDLTLSNDALACLAAIRDHEFELAANLLNGVINASRRLGETTGIGETRELHVPAEDRGQEVPKEDRLDEDDFEEASVPS